MALAVHLLACLLGTGSWVAINGLWVELPLLVPSVPEGWLLPSYLTVVIQLANVGPLLVTLTHRFLPGRLNEVALIYALLALGGLACLLLAFFWGETSVVRGAPCSLALLGLLFCLALVDCTSSVTFLPYMRRLPPQYLTTYFVGEGLSGLVPGLVALVQGVGIARCVNSSLTANGTGLEVVYEAPRFSADAFFLFLSGMMAVSLAAFILLNHLPAARHERAKEKYQVRLRIKGPGDGMQATVEESTMAHSASRSSSRSWAQTVYIFVVLAWVNALTNGTMPTVQSYSCLPYGNVVYHLSATLAALANPLACFLGMFLPNRSLVLMGTLSMTGSLLACYIMAMAVLSPCPPFLHLPAGAILIVLCWVLFVGTLSYVKLMIGMILRDEGHRALVWCGAVVQVGSMVGALTIFPTVSVFVALAVGIVVLLLAIVAADEPLSSPDPTSPASSQTPEPVANSEPSMPGKSEASGESEMTTPLEQQLTTGMPLVSFAAADRSHTDDMNVALLNSDASNLGPAMEAPGHSHESQESLDHDGDSEESLASQGM